MTISSVWQSLRDEASAVASRERRRARRAAGHGARADAVGEFFARVRRRRQGARGHLRGGRLEAHRRRRAAGGGRVRGAAGGGG